MKRNVQNRLRRARELIALRESEWFWQFSERKISRKRSKSERVQGEQQREHEIHSFQESESVHLLHIFFMFIQWDCLYIYLSDFIFHKKASRIELRKSKNGRFISWSVWRECSLVQGLYETKWTSIFRSRPFSCCVNYGNKVQPNINAGPNGEHFERLSCGVPLHGLTRHSSQQKARGEKVFCKFKCSFRWPFFSLGSASRLPQKAKKELFRQMNKKSSSSATDAMIYLTYACQGVKTSIEKWFAAESEQNTPHYRTLDAQKGIFASDCANCARKWSEKHSASSVAIHDSFRLQNAIERKPFSSSTQLIRSMTFSLDRKRDAPARNRRENENN